MDLVELFRSTNTDAEMEAMNIRGLLESNAIPAVIVGNPQIPALEFIVKVPKVHLEEAERVLIEAQAAGPAMAEEAERNFERSGENGIE